MEFNNINRLGASGVLQIEIESIFYVEEAQLESGKRRHDYLFTCSKLVSQHVIPLMKKIALTKKIKTVCNQIV
jgi:hypothetical protein